MFGRKKQSALDRLQSALVACHDCGIAHDGMFDLAAFAPDHWEGPEEREPNNALRMNGDFLSEDFCVIGGEHFFVRGVMEIPVEGLAEKFGFGCWSTLSRNNFELYADGFDSTRPDDIGPWTGWFGNTLKPYPSSVNQPCSVFPQLDRQRPVILLEDLDHPLAQAQEHGVTVNHLLAIYGANGHELGAAPE